MKFSIRDLFLVTVIVALAVGWCVDMTKLADEVRRLSPDPNITTHYSPRWAPISSALRKPPNP